MYTPIDPVFFFSFDFANLKRIRSFSNVELIWLTLTGHMRLSLRMITCVKLKSLRAKQFGCFFTIRSTNRTQIECEARDYGPKCDGIQLRQEHDLCLKKPSVLIKTSKRKQGRRKKQHLIHLKNEMPLIHTQDVIYKLLFREMSFTSYSTELFILLK